MNAYEAQQKTKKAIEDMQKLYSSEQAPKLHSVIETEFDQKVNSSINQGKFCARLSIEIQDYFPLLNEHYINQVKSFLKDRQFGSHNTFIEPDEDGCSAILNTSITW